MKKLYDNNKILTYVLIILRKSSLDLEEIQDEYYDPKTFFIWIDHGSIQMYKVLLTEVSNVILASDSETPHSFFHSILFNIVFSAGLDL